MKTKMLVVLLGGLVLVAGCVSTVNDRSTAAWPLVKDKFEGRYQRPPDQVYAAAVAVLRNNGAVARESIINPGPTQVRTIEAKVQWPERLGESRSGGSERHFGDRAGAH